SSACCASTGGRPAALSSSPIAPPSAPPPVPPSAIHPSGRPLATAKRSTGHPYAIRRPVPRATGPLGILSPQLAAALRRQQVGGGPEMVAVKAAQAQMLDRAAGAGQRDTVGDLGRYSARRTRHEHQPAWSVHRAPPDATCSASDPLTR